MWVSDASLIVLFTLFCWFGVQVVFLDLCYTDKWIKKKKSEGMRCTQSEMPNWANWTIPVHLDERGKKGPWELFSFYFPSLVTEMYDMCESGYFP